MKFSVDVEHSFGCSTISYTPIPKRFEGYWWWQIKRNPHVFREAILTMIEKGVIR